jgi:hypothetical protein
MLIKLIEEAFQLQQRKKEIFIAAASVIGGAALLIAYFQSGPDAPLYAKGQEAFEAWEAAPADAELYRKMEEVLRKTPDLKKKYEAVVAQKLIDTEKWSDALRAAQNSIARVRDDVPYHAEYGQNTLLIEKGEYQKALEKAVALKEQLVKKPISGAPVLYVHNLLRIACLQQKLKNMPGEKAAWDELEPYLQQSTAYFSDKQFDLSQYIKERKKAL